MSCTTLLVGKKASNDNTTMISRTDDGHFDVKKLISVTPEMQPKVYKSIISHLEITLPDNPLRYTACPNVDTLEGLWAATGINAANVGMTATETITSNPRVLAADPLVTYKKAKKSETSDYMCVAEGYTKEEAAVLEPEAAGGIGEEDIVILVLPYIRSAREGVIRLASLLEQYGTYESNGIAFNDENEVWWFETIGGHHWLAKRIPDNVVVVNPNQYGMDSFDLADALGKQENHMCSADMLQFIEENHLDLNNDSTFNPRNIFGSHDDSDHVYNTPRAWFMGRYLAPKTYKWEGPDADFTPESDDIPWSFVPERKVAVEDVKYLLSSYFQGTPFNPYTSHESPLKGIYRPIGINRTGVTSICQIRSDVPEEIKGIEWICFGSNAFNAILPLYANVDIIPSYLSDVETSVSTDNLYWGSRMIAALADPYFGKCVQHIERYQDAVIIGGRKLLKEYDQKVILALNGETSVAALKDDMAVTTANQGATMAAPKDDMVAATTKDEAVSALLEEANEKICEMTRGNTIKTLGHVLSVSSEQMKNGYSRADN